MDALPMKFVYNEATEKPGIKDTMEDYQNRQRYSKTNGTCTIDYNLRSRKVLDSI